MVGNGSCRRTSPAARGIRTAVTADRRRHCWRGPSSARSATLRLARLTVELIRPVPMAGFAIETEVVKAGRATGTSRATIVDGGGVPRALATGMHVARSPVGLFPARSTTAERRLPDSPTPSRDPFRSAACATTSPRSTDRSNCVTRPVRAPDSGRPRSGCARSPCSRTRSRHRSNGSAPWRTAATRSAATPTRPRCSSSTPISRSPCTAIRWASGSAAGASSHWQPTGVGLADALLFDDEGAVGRALQTLLIRPVG